EPREFVLLRQRPLELSAVRQLFDDPVVQGPMVLKFERANRVRDPFERVGNRMREIVQRVDAPLVAGAVMRRVANSIDRGIAQSRTAGGSMRRRASGAGPSRTRASGPIPRSNPRIRRLLSVDSYRRSEDGKCRRSPPRVRSSGQSTWRGRNADSHSAPAGIA